MIATAAAQRTRSPRGRAHAWHGLCGAHGTDLYRDIVTDASAQRSLALAQALVVRERGPHRPDAARQGAVIFQSTTARQPLAKSRRHLRAVMFGHLREENPTDAVRRCLALATATSHRPHRRASTRHSARGARRSAVPNYRWLGGFRTGRCAGESSARTC
jgi:hypothetical protein